MSTEKSRLRDGTHDIPGQADMLRKIMETINVMLQYLNMGLQDRTLYPYQAKTIVRIIERLIRVYRQEITHRPGPHSGTDWNAKVIERWLAHVEDVVNNYSEGSK